MTNKKGDKKEDKRNRREKKAEIQKSPGRDTNRNAGRGKRADASSVGAEPGKQK